MTYGDYRQILELLGVQIIPLSSGRSLSDDYRFTFHEERDARESIKVIL